MATKHETGIKVGTVVGNTSPQEFSFILKSFTAKLGDLVRVEMEIPAADGQGRKAVLVWGRIVELGRSNPFLPAEAGQELARISHRRKKAPASGGC